MKIGLLIYGSLETLSGGYLYDRKLVEYLRAQGDHVEIVSLPWRNYAAHLSDNFTFKLPAGLNVLIQDELNHPSLIFANRKPHPYPIVSLVHHLRCSELRPRWQNELYKIVERKYLQSVDGFIFNSQTTKSAVGKVLGSRGLESRGLESRRLESRRLENRGVENSIVAYPPTDRFGEGVTEEEIKIRAEQQPFRILFLGNVMRRKGLHILIDALRLTNFNFQLDVVGSLTVEPAYANAIRRQVSGNGLSSAVRFHGALDNEDLTAKMKQAHVLVVPSSYEGFGIVYLEGMGFGLPAIGTTAGAAGELIAHGGTGFLIPPEDSSSLAAHLTRLSQNRAWLAETSVKALRRYRQQPKWNETAKSIREFLLRQVQ